jgi:L-ascorbate metabolism protein UlaG (beta-lactamase superfamily)
MRGIRTILLLVALTVSAPPAASQTYLANNGVMYGSGRAKIVVDGLFRFYRDIYPPLPDSLRSRLETAEGRFDGVSFLLSTHGHRDHMHPAAVASHLCSAPDAVALVPDQVRAEVLDAAECALAPERVMSGTEGVERTGMRVTAVPVPHVNPERFADVENRAYVIQSAGGRIVHLGDSGLTEELASEPIDVLTTPYWNIGDDRFMRLWEQAGRPFLIAVHVSPGDHDRLRARYAEMDIDVWVPETPFESVGAGIEYE